MPRHPLIGTPYTFCAQVIIAGVQHWANERSYDGEVAYFFEAGHRSQAEADGLMRKVFHQPELKRASRYKGHAFVQKADAPPVQAADLLAWQWYTDLRHRSESRPRRKDCEALLQHPHKAVHVASEKILELAQLWNGNAAESEALRSLHLGDGPS
jgi:hypothetical protein